MLSTTLTVFDGIPRTLEKTTLLLLPKLAKKEKALYRIYMLMLGVGALLLLAVFIENMQSMVDLATVLSFCTAPFFALANYLVISGRAIPKGFRPGRGMRWLSRAGIVLLSGFAAYYLFTLLR
jgi:Mn2+/Fe2+ NRAMP family transporter